MQSHRSDPCRHPVSRSKDACPTSPNPKPSKATAALKRATSPKKLSSLSLKPWIEQQEEALMREIVADWRKEQTEQDAQVMLRQQHQVDLQPQRNELLTSPNSRPPTRSQELQHTIEQSALNNPRPCEFTNKSPPHSPLELVGPRHLGHRRVIMLPPVESCCSPATPPTTSTQVGAFVSREVSLHLYWLASLYQDQCVDVVVVMKQMQQRLDSQLTAKLEGNKWQSEVCSALARPLDSSVFCDITLHPLDGPKFEYQHLTFPYAEVAHQNVRRLGKWYRRKKFHESVLLHLDILARKFLVLRKTFTVFGHLHRLAKSNERRQRRHHALSLRVSARKIQISWRNFCAWRKQLIRDLSVHIFDHQLLPQAMFQAFVARTIAVSHLLVVEEVEIASQTALDNYRNFVDTKRQTARRIYLHVMWVCRTRILLFIPLKWPKLVSRSRHRNVERMQQLLEVLHEAEQTAENEFESFMQTAKGKQARKEAVQAWRTKVQKQHADNKSHLAQQSPSPTNAGQDAATSPNRHFASDKEQQEYLRVCRCFEHFDLDLSGTIDWEEFQMFMQMLLRESGISTADQDQHEDQSPGRTTKDSAGTATLAPIPQSKRKNQLVEWRKCFDNINRSHNERISLDEFYEWWAQETHKAATASAGAGGKTNQWWTCLGRDAWWHLVGKSALEKQIVRHKMLAEAQAKARQQARSKFFEAQRESSKSRGTQLTVRWRQCDQCLLPFATQLDLTTHDCQGKIQTDDPFKLQRWITRTRQKWSIRA